MTPADLARLELAKRAFRATEPTTAEIQRGVRRARIALQRPKERRRWLSKGLVMVVLAVGGLAYAKPHAVSHVLAQLQAVTPPGKPMVVRSGAGPAAPVIAEAAPHGAELSAVEVARPADVARPEAATTGKARELQPRARAPQVRATDALRPEPPPPAGADISPVPSAESAPAASNTLPSNAAGTSAISGWGRVGQALVRGDEEQALSVLSDLSQSTDQRTRDKADLGRAQLFMSRGDSARACSLARSLTERGAGGSIDRQAQALLKSCPR